MELQNLGNKIRAIRQSRSITQEQLAEKVDISTNFMSLIENGRNMSVETLVKIASSLGVTVDYLLSDTFEINNDTIIAEISRDLSTLNSDEKMFFLSMIKQYKEIKN